MNNDKLWDREYPTEQEILEQEKSLYEEDDDYVEMEYEEIDEDSFSLDAFDDFEEEKNIIDNARIRLEQGRLYEMLIKHDLFDGVDADPKAVSNVQQEIKSFIMERLEILLGMRAEKEVEVYKVESQFNDMEVQALKMVASKVTQGQSAKVPEPKKEPSPLSPVQKQEKTKGLNTLGKKIGKQPVRHSLKPKINKKVVKQQPKRKLKKEIVDTSTKDMSVDEIAMKDIKYLETLKNMPLEKKAEIVAERHKKPRTKSAIAGAGSEQQAQDIINSHYQTKTSVNQEANHWIALLKKAGKI